MYSGYYLWFVFSFLEVYFLIQLNQKEYFEEQLINPKNTFEPSRNRDGNPSECPTRPQQRIRSCCEKNLRSRLESYEVSVALDKTDLVFDWIRIRIRSKCKTDK